MLENAAYRWLDWAREIQALAQTGLHYATNEFDHDRYARLSELAAEIIHTYSDLPLEGLTKDFLEQNGYATPKVDVRAAVFQGGKILLVREASDGFWAMPGGWADVGDVPSRGAAREVREEAGYQVKATRLIGVYDANRTHGRPLELFHAVKLLFLCELLGGEAATSHETLEVSFFGEHEIPPLSQLRTQPRHIADAFAALADPGKLAVYD